MPCANCGNNHDSVFCPECGALNEDQLNVTVSDSEPQRVFNDRYVVLSLLGRGGMGAVYLARDTQLDKTVALKSLPTEVSSDLRAIDWMKEEVRIAQDLRHENIAAIYNFEVDPGKQSSYIIMEFINGVDLHALLARIPEERASVELVSHILEGCASALGYAHSKRIIHRDIKPKNIMVTRDGLIKVTDFGIARRLKETMSKISQTMIAGTPAYMAPEHIMGGKIDSRADIYSMGAMVYELLSGEPPFHKGQIDIQILQKPVPPLDAEIFKGDEVRAERINEVLAKCLSKNPEERYETAGEFYNAFCEAAGTGENDAGRDTASKAYDSMSAAITAALVDQRDILSRTITPPARTGFEPTQTPEARPPEPGLPQKVETVQRRGLVYAIAGAVVAIVAAAVLIPLFMHGSGEEVNGQNKPAVAKEPEGPPKLAISEFIVEGDVGSETSMSLANTVMYRVKKRIKDRYKLIEPLELKGILESLGMKVSQLTDYESASHLYDERGIRYLIVCTVVKGAATELEGRMIDLKEKKVMQSEKPWIRYINDLRRGAERLGDVLTLDDTHKKIYELLEEAHSASLEDDGGKAMEFVAEALKLDKDDETIQKFKVELTENFAKWAKDKADWKQFDRAAKLYKAALKHNFSPETVKKLPEELVLVLLKEGDELFNRNKLDEAIKAYETALEIREDKITRQKLNDAKVRRDAPVEDPYGKGGKHKK